MGLAPGVVRFSALVLAIGVATGCATAPVAVPEPPDESLLAEAQAMMDKARDAGASELAPDPLREARRRLAAARGILYRAAGSGGLDEAQTQRVQRLADEAHLDARLALARTQANAVARKLAELRAELAAPPRGRP